MKKKILFAILLLLTMFNFTAVEAKVADVSIKDVELIDKTGKTEIINDATFSGMNINYNLIFKEVNDSVKYRITIENKGVEDVYINNKGQIGDSNFIVYDYIWDDNQNVIKGNSSKTFDLSITYKKQVESKDFEKGKYVESKDLVIRISDQKGNNLPAKNPNTDSNLSIFIIILSIEILAILGVTLFLIKNRKLNIRNLKNISKANKVTIGLFLIMVLGSVIGYSYALESAEIRLNSVIKISKARLARSCYSDSFALENPNWHRNGHEFISPLNDTGELTANDKEEPYSGSFCIDWNSILDFNYLMDYIYEEEEEQLTPHSEEEVPMRRDSQTSRMISYRPYIDITTSNSKTMKEEISRYGNSYTLIGETDVSDIQNGEVILGIYQGNRPAELLFVIGEDDGVQAPVDSSWLFATEEPPVLTAYNNKSKNTSIFDIPKEVINDLKNVEPNIMLFASEIELDNIDFSDTNNMSGMFNFNGVYTDYTYLTGLKNWDTSNVKDMSGMFFFAGNHNNQGIIDGISGLDTQNVINMQGMFTGSDVKFVNGDISNWDTSKVKDMAGMFSGAFNDADKLNISKWNVSSVEDMTYMFANGLNSLTKFDISEWDTRSAKSMRGMFQSSLEEVQQFDLSKWNTSNVETMEFMFCETLYEVKNFDISAWNTSKVKSMECMFCYSLDNLTTFDLSDWDVSNVENMSGMFSMSLINASRLNLSNWNTTSVNDISDMFNSAFAESTKVDLYINKFNLSKFTNPSQFEYIFYGMPINENVSIYVKNNDEKGWILNLDRNYISDQITPNNIKITQ